jgi:hypothetical protein
MPNPLNRPIFCGQPGWPACPPVNGALPGKKIYSLADMDEYGWQCYMQGREDEKNGVALGPIPPWLNGITLEQVKAYQKSQGR